jgi:hypothetical protein
MARHHFVPQFVLRGWSVNGRIVSYRWIDGAQKAHQNTQQSVADACQIANLNDYFGLPRDRRDFPEVGFFTPKIDTPASVAYNIVLRDGLSALTAAQCADWAGLLVSFAVRTPETLRTMGPDEWSKAAALVRSTRHQDADGEVVVDQILEAARDQLRRNIPLNVAMDLAADPEKRILLQNMTWWCRSSDRDNVLIGDRPLLATPRMPYPCGMPLDNPGAFIIMPMDSKTIFFASADPKTKSKIRSMPLSRVINLVNEETIWRATDFVFAKTTELEEFVKERLEGNAKGTWQPG